MNNSKYICKDCKYHTDKQSNFKRHIESQKHEKNLAKNTQKKTDFIDPQKPPSDPLKKVTTMTICKYCFVEFSKSCHKIRHEKACSRKIIQEKEYLLKRKDEENIMLKEMIEILQIQATEHNKTFNKAIIKNASNMNKALETMYTSVKINKYLVKGGNKKFVIENCKDPDEINSLVRMEEDEYFRIIAENNNTIKEEDNENFILDLMAYKRRNTLHIIISDFIIKHYGKTDRRKHSLHSTDTARLNFIYAVLDKKIDCIKWINDVNGAEVTKLIINPILEFMVTETEKFKSIHLKIMATTGNQLELKNINDAIDLANYLSPKKTFKKTDNLQKKILSKISTFFDINKIDIKVLEN